MPLSELMADVTTPIWYQLFASDAGAKARVQDAGYRRGSDILKALALGANAVLLGRTTRWALAAFGTPGVERLLDTIQRELIGAAATAGRSTLASIDRSLVKANFT